MNKNTKMNFLYKIGFILFIICFLLFITSIITAYLFRVIRISVILSAGGFFLAFVGILLVMFSKPMLEKEKICEQAEIFVDNKGNI